MRFTPPMMTRKVSTVMTSAGFPIGNAEIAAHHVDHGLGLKHVADAKAGDGGKEGEQESPATSSAGQARS